VLAYAETLLAVSKRYVTIGGRDWLLKLRLSLEYLYIIGWRFTLLHIPVGTEGAFVGIDNEVNRYVCDRILKFSEHCSALSMV
jgi:hypothetical protein